ncbi:MAG: RNA polymerase-binding protein DksA [Chromatiaceae bacterium]|nr:RNA polymerase-binding protein DksA [Gammaproteobacteria bacterium]MCP5306542.1 RNA polymerase-binding protein DksA [Chromatiaceae bacterium]MCP5312094.1 RNA polymerase-binding protein DksA [Chromatiaceae bacterium]
MGDELYPQNDRHGIAPYQAAPDEVYMNPAQEAHFQAILQAWRRELMEEVDRTVDHMKVDSGQHPDPNDRASQESDMDMELRTRERERRLLGKIEKTLKKIDEHEYGYCVQCGVEIGIRRLEARPTADLCIDCKTKQEAHEQLHG